MPRGYESPARAEAARETRRRILAAAHRLLVEHGYTEFGIASLARAAGVSPQTVYNSIGGKAEVIKAAYDLALAGDDEPVSMSERPAFRALARAATPEEWALAYAHWVRHVMEHVGDIVSAALRPGEALDSGAGAFAATIDRERRIGTTHAVSAVADRFALPRDEPVERLIDAVWTLNAPEVYDRLVRRCGWTLDEYEAWLARQLRTALGA